MSGKRGRASALRENNYGSSGSFDKYFNSRHNKKPTLKNRSKSSDSGSAINKEKVREGLNENKKYESINKLSKRGGEWDSVYKKSEKSGISTKKLEVVSRKLGNSHVINEYGFKPHVKVVTSQYNDLKQKGYLPNTHIKEYVPLYISSFIVFLGFDSNLVAKVLLVSASSQGQAYGLW